MPPLVQLQESERRLQLALSAGRGIGTWDWDVANDLVVTDERFARLYGVDPVHAKRGAPIGFFFQGIHPDDLLRVQAAVEEALRTGELFSEEYRLRSTDGQERWLLAEGRCERADDGSPTRFPGVSFDITDREASLDDVDSCRDVVLLISVAKRPLREPLFSPHLSEP